MGDLITTRIGLANGLVEMNSLMENSYMVLIKILSILIVIGLIYYLYKTSLKDIPFVRKFVYGLCFIVFLAVANNVYWLLLL